MGCENQVSGKYDGERAKVIDKFLKLAGENGIRVKMCIEFFRDIPAEKVKFFDKPLHNKANGGPFRDMDDFLNSSNGREQFKRKLAWFAERYGDNPAVFAWELWNEMNCVRGEWLEWTQVMLEELHSLFPKNLAIQSLGSFDSDGIRERYRKTFLLPENDIAQVHRYLDLGAQLEICHGPVDILSVDSVNELLAFETNKPIILTETGAVKPRHTGCSELYEKDKDGILLHDMLFAPFFAGAAGTGHGWFWREAIEKPNLWYHFTRFAKAVDGIDPPAEKFMPAIIPHLDLRVYALKGQNTFIAWCRDTKNDWQSELEQGIPPANLNNISLDVSEHIEAGQDRSVSFYDPWQDAWSSGTYVNGKIALPEFRRSIVAKVE